MERPLGAAKPSVPGESDRDVLWQAANAFRTTQALYVIAKLGIADLLRDGPRSVDDLAAATGTMASALNRLLRALASVGIFAYVAGHAGFSKYLGLPYVPGAGELAVGGAH